MRPAAESSGSVPAFLIKLWHLVNDEATNELISWDLGGMSFHILEQSRFANEILPLYFKHRNIASFIRQLNMYGFRKVVHVEPLNLSIKEQVDMEFSHQYFIQGQEHLLEYIKRKVPNTTTTTVSPRKTGVMESVKKDEEEEVDKVVTDVNGIKGKQDSMSSQVESLKIQNDLLWQEVAKLRKEHGHHTMVIEKLVHFLIGLGLMRKNTITTAGSMKRKLPLMIESAPGTSQSSQPSAKIRRGNSTDYSSDLVDLLLRCCEGRPSIQELPDNDVDTSHVSTDNADMSASFADNSNLYNNVQFSHQQPFEPLSLVEVDENCGTNQELKHLFDSSTVNDVLLHDHAMSSALCTSSATTLTQDVSTDTQSTDMPHFPSCDVTTVALSDPLLSSGLDSADLSSQIDALQANMHNIKELFTCGQYNFDASSLFGLYDLGLPGYENDEDNSQDGENFKGSQKIKTEPIKSIVGNEVIQYVPQDHDYKDIFQELLSPSYRPLEMPLYEHADLFDSN